MPLLFARPALVACALLAACGAAAPTDFDAQRAFDDLRAQVEIGPRPAGSEASERTREFIRTRLRQAGWPVEEHVFEAAAPGGAPVRMVNLIASRPGTSDAELWLAAHYDTKPIPGVHFVGANDGASGVAVLLELARALANEPGPLGLKLVFFDGEEAFGPRIGAGDGLFGSRALAERMQREGTLRRIRTLILFDMVADRELTLTVDLNSSPERRAQLEKIAGPLVDREQSMRIVDDHVPFIERGLSDTLLLIDFQYGSRGSPGPLWHTAEDDLRGVSAESLNRIGAVAVELVRSIQGEARTAN
jgi:glutaminyl-peptide cyclotransferase